MNKEDDIFKLNLTTNEINAGIVKDKNDDDKKVIMINHFHITLIFQKVLWLFLYFCYCIW